MVIFSTKCAMLYIRIDSSIRGGECCSVKDYTLALPIEGYGYFAPLHGQLGT
jgi:hypothetical protein